MAAGPDRRTLRGTQGRTKEEPMYGYASPALAEQHRADQLGAAHRHRHARGVAQRPRRNFARLVLTAFGLFR
jgi:hypothetical protein